MEQFVLVPVSSWHSKPPTADPIKQPEIIKEQESTKVLTPTTASLPKTLQNTLSKNKNSKKILQKVYNEPRVQLSSSGTLVLDGNDTNMKFETFIKSLQSTKKQENKLEDFNLTLLDILKIDPSSVRNTHVKQESRGNWTPFTF